MTVHEAPGAPARRIDALVLEVDRRRVVLEIDGLRHAVDVDLTIAGGEPSVRASSRDGTRRFTRASALGSDSTEETTGDPRSPLPGTVLALDVAAGDRVEAGQRLALIEAMKMEHRIVAAHAGIVREVRVAVGQRVRAGDVVVVLGPPEA
jgi:biotin carboxyl carrier protein